MQKSGTTKTIAAVLVSVACAVMTSQAAAAYEVQQNSKVVKLTSGQGQKNQYDIFIVEGYEAGASDAAVFDPQSEGGNTLSNVLLTIHSHDVAAGLLDVSRLSVKSSEGIVFDQVDMANAKDKHNGYDSQSTGMVVRVDAPSITYENSTFDGVPLSIEDPNEYGDENIALHEVVLQDLNFSGNYLNRGVAGIETAFGAAQGRDIYINSHQGGDLSVVLDNLTFDERDSLIFKDFNQYEWGRRNIFSVQVAAVRSNLYLTATDFKFEDPGAVLELQVDHGGTLHVLEPITANDNLARLEFPLYEGGNIYFDKGFFKTPSADVLFPKYINALTNIFFNSTGEEIDAKSVVFNSNGTANPNQEDLKLNLIMPMKEGQYWAAYKGSLAIHGGKLILWHDLSGSENLTQTEMADALTKGFTVGTITTLNKTYVALPLKEMILLPYASELSTGSGLIEAMQGHDHDLLGAAEELHGSFTVFDGHWNYADNRLDQDADSSLMLNSEENGASSATGSVNQALADGVVAHIKVDEFNRTGNRLSVHSLLSGITVDAGKYMPLTGNIGDGSTSLNLVDGIDGEGGIRIEKGDASEGSYDGVYLGGTNTYTGATVIGEDAKLHVTDSEAVKGSKDLIVEANGHLYLPESFDHDWDSVVFMGGITNTSSTGSGGEETYTLIDGGTGGDVAAPSIKVAGVGKHMSFFQSDNEQSDSGASTLSETDAGTDENSASVPHHVVEVKNVDLSVLDGAAFWVNALEGRGTTTPGDQFTQEMAVLKLGSGSSLTIAGHADDSADAPTSSHMYLGNGIVQVQNGGTLTLGADSAIHFSSHMPGFFEWKGSKEDPHHHASVELSSGSTLNVTLGEYNHIYSDKILEEGHQHFLIGTAWDERQSQTQANSETNPSNEYFDGRAVNVQLTKVALEKISNALATGDYGNPYVTEQHAQALSAFMQAADAQKINLTDSNSLFSLKTELVGGGLLSEDQFHQALTAMLSMSMNNNRHSAWQDYLLTSEAGGIYMTVEDTKQWDEVTDIRLSLNNETNEVVQLEAHSTENADRLTELAASSGAYQIISNAVNNYTMGTTTEESFRTAARIIDSAGQIATVGGAQTLAWDMLQTRRDSVSRHQDRLGGGELRNNLWVDVLYMNNKSHDMWNDLNGDREVKANLGGVIVGADAAVTNDLRVGAAFSWMDGSSETNLGMSEQTSTTNEVQGAAATFYGDYRFSDALRLKFDVGYQWGMNDLTMSFPTAMGIGEALKADVDTHTVQGNVTLEYGIDLAAGVSLVPFAGVGYTYLVTEGYTSTLGNKAAFRTESSRQQIVSVPVGVKLEGRLVNESTVFKPRLVAYVQPNFGDTEADNEVRGAGLTTVDRVNPEVIGEWSYGVSCGLAMELSDRVTLGFDYGFNGSNQSRNHSLTGSLRYAF